MFIYNSKGQPPIDKVKLESYVIPRTHTHTHTHTFTAHTCIPITNSQELPLTTQIRPRHCSYWPLMSPQSRNTSSQDPYLWSNAHNIHTHTQSNTKLHIKHQICDFMSTKLTCFMPNTCHAAEDTVDADKITVVHILLGH